MPWIVLLEIMNVFETFMNKENIRLLVSQKLQIILVLVYDLSLTLPVVTSSLEPVHW